MFQRNYFVRTHCVIVLLLLRRNKLCTIICHANFMISFVMIFAAFGQKSRQNRSFLILFHGLKPVVIHVKPLWGNNYFSILIRASTAIISFSLPSSGFISSSLISVANRNKLERRTKISANSFMFTPFCFR